MMDKRNVQTCMKDGIVSCNSVSFTYLRNLIFFFHFKQYFSEIDTFFKEAFFRLLSLRVEKLTAFFKEGL